MMLMLVPCRGSVLASLQAQRLQPLVHLKHSPAAPCQTLHAARCTLHPAGLRTLRPCATPLRGQLKWHSSLVRVVRVDEKAGLDPSARPVFLLNCMCALSDVLAHHACCASGAAAVAAQVGLRSPSPSLAWSAA